MNLIAEKRGEEGRTSLQTPTNTRLAHTVTLWSAKLLKP